MVRRKVSTPKQRIAQAKWQAAGVAARKAKAAIKPQSTGRTRRHNAEMVTLYHRTNETWANAILKEGLRFQSDASNTTQEIYDPKTGKTTPFDPSRNIPGVRKPIFFSTKLNDPAAEEFGSMVFKVQVPRKAIHKDTDAKFKGNRNWVVVPEHIVRKSKLAMVTKLPPAPKGFHYSGTFLVDRYGRPKAYVDKLNAMSPNDREIEKLRNQYYDNRIGFEKFKRLAIPLGWKPPQKGRKSQKGRKPRK